MNTRLIFSMLSILCLISLQPAYGQDGTGSDYRHKLNGIGIHGGIGWSLYGKGSTGAYQYGAFLPSGGFHARWFLTSKVAIFHSLDYLSLGAKSRTTASASELRLRTLQLSNSIELFFKAKPNKPVLSVKGGFFIGRTISSTHYWELFGSGLRGQNTPINTFGDWNAGLTTGAEVSKKVGKGHSLSSYFQYDLGIKNVLISNLPEGMNTFTRAYRLGFSFTFH